MLKSVWRPAVSIAGLAVIAGFAFGSAAQAESIQKQCSEKYQAAKAANSLNGETWNQFYKQCAADLKGGGAATTTSAPPPATTSAPPPAATTSAPPPAATTEAAPKKKHWWHHENEATTPSAPPPVATGNIVFPNAISPQYKDLSPGRARFKTCDDQYRANKPTGANGGLKWIEKGGGYYSECNKHLKGLQ
ncbi:MAG: hypothetical protein P4L68_07320 [Methylovirgula sp.]|nr:hypothetical protein [Methylovirgula sp.]